MFYLALYGPGEVYDSVWANCKGTGGSRSVQEKRGGSLWGMKQKEVCVGLKYEGQRSRWCVGEVGRSFRGTTAEAGARGTHVCYVDQGSKRCVLVWGDVGVRL